MEKPLLKREDTSMKLLVIALCYLSWSGGIAQGTRASDSGSSVGITVTESDQAGPLTRGYESPYRPTPLNYLQLEETIPPSRLTVLADQAVALAPLRIREELKDNFARLTPTHQDLYAQMILTPTDPRFTDELAFCIAEVAAEILQSDTFLPNLLEENVYYVYEHDQYLDYVRIVDVGEPGLDDDYYSTTRYLVEEAGIVTEYELEPELYYWFIVHPKIEDEMVDYVDPNTVNAPHADPPTGVFWRDWLFTYTEPIPELDVDYPILRDRVMEAEVLWKSTVNSIDNGAVGAINQWVLDTLDFTSGAERPKQPVRIYKLHQGRCGEHQDFTSAASRACLIPCLNTEAINEDHVWNEFWDRRWIHWEPVNVMVDSALTYENGWGKAFSGVINVYGDGYIWNVLDRYSEGFCSVTVQVEDANGDPVDGAQVSFKKPGGYAGLWGYTGSTGSIMEIYGDGVSCTTRISSPLGKFPADGFYTISSLTDDGESYNWTATYPTTLPQLLATPLPDQQAETPYRAVIEYAVLEEVVVGDYQYDRNHNFTRRQPTGSVDVFIVDEANWTLYAAYQEFAAYQLTKFTPNGAISFGFPNIDDWTIVFSAERKLTCTQILDVAVILEQQSGPEWIVLETVTRVLPLFPGERYTVSVALPPKLGVTLSMPAHSFEPGDVCGLTLECGNPGEPLTAVPLFVLLDVLGTYWFYPTWNLEPPAWVDVDVPTGVTSMIILEPFAWPEGAGSADGIYFHAAMTDKGITQLLGDMDSWEFGWSD